MARTTTAADPDKLDDHGIERSTDDAPGAIDAYRDKWPWFDHVMRMNERYGDQGGNHFAAGITYFSVLSIFPLVMLIFATVAMVLAGNEELMNDIADSVTESAGDDLGATINDIIDGAIDQRGSVFGIGLVLALWTGLGWMANLRLGVSEMWKVDGKAANFITGKIQRPDRPDRPAARPGRRPSVSPPLVVVDSPGACSTPSDWAISRASRFITWLVAWWWH